MATPTEYVAAAFDKIRNKVAVGKTVDDVLARIDDLVEEVTRSRMLLEELRKAIAPAEDPKPSGAELVQKARTLKYESVILSRMRERLDLLPDCDAAVVEQRFDVLAIEAKNVRGQLSLPAGVQSSVVHGELSERSNALFAIDRIRGVLGAAAKALGNAAPISTSAIVADIEHLLVTRDEVRAERVREQARDDWAAVDRSVAGAAATAALVRIRELLGLDGQKPADIAIAVERELRIQRSSVGFAVGLLEAWSRWASVRADGSERQWRELPDATLRASIDARIEALSHFVEWIAKGGASNPEHRKRAAEVLVLLHAPVSVCKVCWSHMSRVVNGGTSEICTLCEDRQRANAEATGG